jgi:chloride channel 3/4/5
VPLGGRALVGHAAAEPGKREPPARRVRAAYTPARSAQLLTILATLCLMIVTFGSTVPAGLFIPSMVHAPARPRRARGSRRRCSQFMGGAMGRLVGTLMIMIELDNRDWALWNCGSVYAALAIPMPARLHVTAARGSNPHLCITPGIYAMVGAAAALAGSTRMTVSLVVIMFEITGGLVCTDRSTPLPHRPGSRARTQTYVVPIMIGIIFAKWVGDAFGKHTIYEEYIHIANYPWLEPAENIPLSLKCACRCDHRRRTACLTASRARSAEPRTSCRAAS